MDSKSAAFEYDFVEKPSPEYFCPVTSLILMDPQQTNKCCGRHLSRVVADDLKRKKAPCPICKCQPLKTTNDLNFKRQVMALKVCCKNKALGCDWIGELSKLAEHVKVGFVEGKCEYENITCPKNCGSQFQRRWLEVHKTEKCEKRSFTCPYCGHKGTYEEISCNHWPQCQKYPLKCPNKCSEENIERRFLNHHLDQDCPLQEIECEFSYAGCRARVERWKMRDHMDRSEDEHLDALAMRVKTMTEQFQAQIRALSVYIPEPIFIQPPEMVLENFEEQRKEDDVWYSPSFYTHIGGYKMCLHVHANGWTHGKNTHVSVLVCMMRGEFDDYLQWPFKGVVTLQLINQREGGEHVEKNIVEENDKTEDSLCRVLEGDVLTEGWGQAKFIRHVDLYKPERSLEYLKDNTLKFQVTAVIVKSV